MDSDTNVDSTFDSSYDHFACLERDGSDIVMRERYNLGDETDDDSDDDNFLDLTATPQAISSSNTTNTICTPSSSSSTPVRTNTPKPLDLLVEDGISEDALVAMGIDINEIRAQKEIERQLEKEAQQLEYAKQLQQQINEGVQNNDDNHESATAAWRHIGLGASSSTSSGKAPMVQQQLPGSYVDTTYNNSEHSTKRFKPNDPMTGPSSSSSSSSTINNDAQPSMSATAGPSSAPIIMIDSDDDDLVDLTSDNTINKPTKFDEYDPYQVIGDDDEEDYDNDSLLMPSTNTNLEAIMHQMYQIQQRQEAQRRYGITMNPLSGLHLEQIPGLFDSSRHHFLGSMSSVPPGFSKGPQQPSSSTSMAEAEEQLRQLLETITDEEPPPPESRTGTPEGLRVNLMEHQKIGFQWMCKQEASTNKGGLLSDDMGLGKTVQAMAVMVARQCTNADPLPDSMSMTAMQKGKAKLEPFKTKCTLVICPVSLMEQWAEEIRTKTENLTVYIHHGPHAIKDTHIIAGFDVVIVSYHKLRVEFPEEENREAGPLNPMIFHRIILDEAHTIKNKITSAAKACYRIPATYRWCLTATPIQNKIEELYSLINFLRIQPYCEWDNFRNEIVTPLKLDRSKTEVMKKVQVIMKAISLRRSKKAEIDGRPILNLPERNIHFTHVDFPPEERRFYNYVDNKVQADFSDYVDAGTVMQNYSSVLVLLLRLRQACLHATLTNIDKPVLKTDEGKQLENAKALKQPVVDRLIGMKDELTGIECPICMDTANEPRIIAGCGHILCRECLSSYVNTSSDYGGQKSCPQCRGELRLDLSVPVAMFFKIHIPELTKVETNVDEALKVEAKKFEFESSTKIDTMLEILAKTREDTKGRDKTIVFSQFTQMLDLMERPLKASGFKFGRYDGSMSLKERTVMIDNFRDDPAMEVLLVSTRCGCLGLNLTMANRVILMDVWWNPALENQAIDRVHRIGQTKDVEVHRLFINNTVEDRILELQRQKQLIADGALGEGSAEKLGRLGLQDMLYLFRGGPPPSVPLALGGSNPSCSRH